MKRWVYFISPAQIQGGVRNERLQCQIWSLSMVGSVLSVSRWDPHPKLHESPKCSGLRELIANVISHSEVPVMWTVGEYPTIPTQIIEVSTNQEHEVRSWANHLWVRALDLSQSQIFGLCLSDLHKTRLSSVERCDTEVWQACLQASSPWQQGEILPCNHEDKMEYDMSLLIFCNFKLAGSVIACKWPTHLLCCKFCRILDPLIIAVILTLLIATFTEKDCNVPATSKERLAKDCRQKSNNISPALIPVSMSIICGSNTLCRPHSKHTSCC